jgi:hypothetical protein
LFVESAEGGAGVLRRLVDEPDALRRAARRALAICHFDPDTGEDTGGFVGNRDERCARACYDCLLSYRNQSSHLLLDRHRAHDILLALAGAATNRTDETPNVQDAWQSAVFAAEDRRPVLRFVRWLQEREHRCPDEVRAELAGPDLIYQLPTGPVAVFVDGEGDAERPDRDELAAEDLRDDGWTVIRIPPSATYQELVGRYVSVFGASRRDGS